MTNQNTLSRRSFLRSTAAASAGAFAAPLFVPAAALGRGRGMTAPSERITMALIGCGGMGNANMNGFLGFDDVRILAVCDPDRSRREHSKGLVDRRYGNSDCAVYNDYREVLARSDIDTIIQATPDHWHGLITVHAAQSGKDIYGEKPLSLTIDEGRLMSDAVARFGRVFQTGSQQRSDDRFRYACELVRNGYLGRVHHVTCGLPTSPTADNQPTIPVPDGFDYDLWLGPAPWAPYCERRTHWHFRWILDYSGGEVTDWGAHHIDIAHWSLGLENTGPVEVEGTGEFPRDGLFNAATNYDFTATYLTGVKVRCTNGVENGVRWEGDEGWLFVNRSRIDASDARILRQPIRDNDVRLTRQHGHRAHWRDFIDSVRSRSQPIAPIEHAHRTITVAHLGNIAMKLGRKVRWNPDTESFINDPTAERMRSRPMRGDWSFDEKF